MLSNVKVALHSTLFVRSLRVVFVCAVISITDYSKTRTITCIISDVWENTNSSENKTNVRANTTHYTEQIVESIEFIWNVVVYSADFSFNQTTLKGISAVLYIWCVVYMSDEDIDLLKYSTKNMQNV